MLTSEVKFYNGRPTLFIEGKPVPAMGYVTYLPERNSYKQFGDAGYRIFSVVTNFGGQPINTITNVGPMEPGIFREKGKENYSSFDKTVTQLISEVPEAVIFPRVNCSMPLWWEEENPDECNFEGLNGNPPRSCFASDAYRTEAKRMLKKFIEHIKNAPYSEHIFGIQIAGGMTEEFLSFDRKGNDGKRAREKFAAENPNGNETDYRRFLSRMTAEVVEDLAKFAKEATGFTMVIGAFYGYVFETLSWKSGHHALRKLIDSPYIDFFASPISYVNRKNPGRSWFIMTPQASHSAHGKIYLGECDTRTFLTLPLSDCRPAIDPAGNYSGGLWAGPDNEEKSRWHLRMNFLRQIAYGHGSWWFDIWGGWFDSPGIMDDMKEFIRLAEHFLHDRNRASVAQCALWIDETALAETKDELDSLCANHGRTALEQSGLVVDYYELGDFEKYALQYRCVFFIAPADGGNLPKAREFCRKHGLPFMTLTGREPIDPAVVRDFAEKAGAFCYCRDHNAAVYASENVIGICAPEDGTYTLNLPAERHWIPLFSYTKEHFNGQSVTLTLRTGEVAGFRLEDITQK